MIKKCLYFGNPAYLSLKLEQLVVKNPEKESAPIKTIPVEDIGIVVLDNKQITLTQGLIEALLNNNCALITCDSKHLPAGLMLPLCGNSIQNERFRDQLDASLPLRKQLWQQTVIQKILNQEEVLEYSTGEEHKTMLNLASKVKSGDPDNIEGQAAVYYWKTIFPDNADFTRERDREDFTNSLLNYGYSILRSIIARALVGSGMLPTLGIHHHNRYNAYCLADDIMEPYRPYVDKLVLDILEDTDEKELNRDIKARLLTIPTIEVHINGKRSPLMVAATTTTASLYKCFSGETRKILYPDMSDGQI